MPAERDKAPRYLGRGKSRRATGSELNDSLHRKTAVNNYRGVGFSFRIAALASSRLRRTGDVMKLTHTSSLSALVHVVITSTKRRLREKW